MVLGNRAKTVLLLPMPLFLYSSAHFLVSSLQESFEKLNCEGIGDGSFSGFLKVMGHGNPFSVHSEEVHMATSASKNELSRKSRFLFFFFFPLRHAPLARTH